MLSEFMAIIGLSPSAIYSELRAIGGAGRTNRAMSGGERRKPDSRKHSVKLWTLRDCQMELLTEGTMRAFEASVTPYAPAQRSSNYAPGRDVRGAGLRMNNVGITSHLIRTLERRADMRPEGVPELYRNGPHIEDGPERLISYVGTLEQPDNQTVNQ